MICKYIVRKRFQAPLYGHLYLLLKYCFVLVNIGLDQLISVWISYYWSRSVSNSLDGVNKKSVG